MNSLLRCDFVNQLLLRRAGSIASPGRVTDTWFDPHICRNLLSNGDYYFTFNVIVDIIFRDAFVRVSVPVVIHILDSRSLFRHR